VLFSPQLFVDLTIISYISLLQSVSKISIGLLRAVSCSLILTPEQEVSKEKLGIFSKISHHEPVSDTLTLLC
jgi:hypothetical protein